MPTTTKLLGFELPPVLIFLTKVTLEPLDFHNSTPEEPLSAAKYTSPLKATKFEGEEIAVETTDVVVLVTFPLYNLIAEPSFALNKNSLELGIKVNSSGSELAAPALISTKVFA